MKKKRAKRVSEPKPRRPGNRSRAAAPKKSSADPMLEDSLDVKQWVMDHVPPEPIRPNRASSEPTIEQVLDVIRWRSPRLRKGQTPEDLIRYRTAKNRVFYYPACGFDWEPLYRFAGRCNRPICDTFIYCDYTIDRTRFLAALEALPNTQAGRQLQVESCKDIPERSLQALLPRADAPPRPPIIAPAVAPWGSLVRLICSTGAPKRIRLIYLGLEGVRLYETLFQRRGRAPEYLCIKQEGGGFGYGRTNFWNWAEPLARAVDPGRNIPKFVIINRAAGPNYDWPWNALWQEFETWHGDFGPPVFVYHRPEAQVIERERNCLFTD